MPITSGVLYDVQTGANYIFQSLKPLCNKLRLNYQGIYSAFSAKRFYIDRYFVDFVVIPKNIYTKFGYSPDEIIKMAVDGKINRKKLIKE